MRTPNLTSLPPERLLRWNKRYWYTYIIYKYFNYNQITWWIDYHGLQIRDSLKTWKITRDFNIFNRWSQSEYFGVFKSVHAWYELYRVSALLYSRMMTTFNTFIGPCIWKESMNVALHLVETSTRSYSLSPAYYSLAGADPGKYVRGGALYWTLSTGSAAVPSWRVIGGALPPESAPVW